MSAVLRPPMTLDDFLAWEREQEFRYEFDGVQPIPVTMTGGTAAHSKIASDLLLLLTARLRPPYGTYRGDMKILAAGRIRYPDLLVVATPVPDESDLAADPVVVVEVLSSSTAIVDRGVKAAEYQATLSIQHCVMLEQGRADAVVRRRGLGRGARVRPERHPALAGVGIALPIAELCRRVRVSP